MEKLDEEQIADFKAAFSMFDKDGSGDVSTEELGAVLKELGQEVSKSQLEIMIKEVDADGSGSVEFPEFRSMMASLLGLGGASDDPFGSGGSVFKDLAKAGLKLRPELRGWHQTVSRRRPPLWRSCRCRSCGSMLRRCTGLQSDI